MGKYSCYSIPVNKNGALGSSKTKMSIEKHKNNKFIISYDAYEIDPYSKSLVVPHVLIRNVKNIINKTNDIKRISNLKGEQSHRVYKTILKAYLRDNVKLQCLSLFKNDSVSRSWLKNGKQMFVNQNQNAKELIIKPMKRDDFGKYSCFVNTSQQTTAQEYFLIKSGNFSSIYEQSKIVYQVSSSLEAYHITMIFLQILTISLFYEIF